MQQIEEVQQKEITAKEAGVVEGANDVFRYLREEVRPQLEGLKQAINAALGQTADISAHTQETIAMLQNIFDSEPKMVQLDSTHSIPNFAKITQNLNSIIQTFENKHSQRDKELVELANRLKEEVTQASYVANNALHLEGKDLSTIKSEIEQATNLKIAGKHSELKAYVDSRVISATSVANIYTNQSISGVSTALNAKISGATSLLSQGLTKLESTLKAKDDALGQQIEAEIERTEEAIEALREHINAQNTDLNGALETYKQQITQRIATVEENVGTTATGLSAFQNDTALKLTSLSGSVALNVAGLNSLSQRVGVNETKIAKLNTTISAISMPDVSGLLDNLRGEFDAFKKETEEEIQAKLESLECGSGSTPPNTITLQKPSIQQPSSNENDFSGAFVVSAIVPSEEVGSFTLRIQVSKQSDFSSIAFNQTLNDSNTLNLLSLEPSTTYYVRARYEVGLVFSEYSEAVQFRTANVYIATPNISVEGDSSGKIVLNPTIQGSEFRVINGSDRHTATTIKVKEQGVTSYIVDKKIMSAITEYQLESPLEINKTYVFDMVYHGENYVSATGTTTKTTQNIFIKTPTLTLDTTSGLRVTTSGFQCVNGEDTHKSTKYTIKKGGIAVVNENSTTNLTSATFALESNGEYILEVVHIGNTYGESLKATKTFNYTKPKTGTQPPLLLGNFNQTITTTPFAFYYGDDKSLNKHLEAVRIEVFNAGRLVYVKEFAHTQERKASGAVSSQTLTTEQQRNLASGVEEAYKAFDNSDGTFVSMGRNEEIQLEYPTPQMLHSYQLAFESGFEATEIKLYGYTSLGYNLLHHSINSDGITTQNTITDNTNAYQKFKLVVLSFKGDICKIKKINYTTSEPPAISYGLKDTFVSGTYNVSIGHKAKDNHFVMGALEEKSFSVTDHKIGFIHSKDYDKIKTYGLSFESEYRSRSTPSKVLSTEKTTEHEQFINSPIFRDMGLCVLNVSNGNYTDCKTKSETEIRTLLNASSTSLMVRIPEVHMVYAPIQLDSKWYEVSLISDQPFEIDITRDMLATSSSGNLSINEDYVKFPNDYKTCIIENNNSRKITLKSAIHPAFSGRFKRCDELFISASAINSSGLCKGNSPAHVSRDSLRGYMGSNPNHALMDFYAWHLMYMLFWIACQKNKSQRAINTPNDNIYLNSQFNAGVFFGFSEIFSNKEFIVDGIDCAADNNDRSQHYRNKSSVSSGSLGTVTVYRPYLAVPRTARIAPSDRVSSAANGDYSPAQNLYSFAHIFNLCGVSLTDRPSNDREPKPIGDERTTFLERTHANKVVALSSYLNSNNAGSHSSSSMDINVLGLNAYVYKQPWNYNIPTSVPQKTAFFINKDQHAPYEKNYTDRFYGRSVYRNWKNKD